MIDLAPEYLDEVRRILASLVPDCEVRAFGSRVTGKARRFSDLDLVVQGEDRLADGRLDALRDAFSASTLPVRVDVVDWHAISESFRAIIVGGSEVLQARRP